MARHPVGKGSEVHRQASRTGADGRGLFSTTHLSRIAADYTGAGLGRAGENDGCAIDDATPCHFDRISRQVAKGRARHKPGDLLCHSCRAL